MMDEKEDVQVISSKVGTLPLDDEVVVVSTPTQSLRRSERKSELVQKESGVESNNRKSNPDAPQSPSDDFLEISVVKVGNSNKQSHLSLGAAKPERSSSVKPEVLPPVKPEKKKRGRPRKVNKDKGKYNGDSKPNPNSIFNSPNSNNALINSNNAESNLGNLGLNSNGNTGLKLTNNVGVDSNNNAELNWSANAGINQNGNAAQENLNEAINALSQMLSPHTPNLERNTANGCMLGTPLDIEPDDIMTVRNPDENARLVNPQMESLYLQAKWVERLEMAENPRHLTTQLYEFQKMGLWWMKEVEKGVPILLESEIVNAESLGINTNPEQKVVGAILADEMVTEDFFPKKAPFFALRWKF